MTREEAKTVFLNRGYVEVEGGTIYDANKWRESCRVISEWLEQEPSDDLISRQAVLKQLRGCLTGGETEYQYVKLHIDSIPSVKQQPKTGHWIDGGEYICFSGRQKAPCICSVCRKSALNEPWYYCPNCGTRMVEPQESEEV